MKSMIVKTDVCFPKKKKRSEGGTQLEKLLLSRAMKSPTQDHLTGIVHDRNFV